MRRRRYYRGPSIGLDLLMFAIGSVFGLFVIYRLLHIIFMGY